MMNLEGYGVRVVQENNFSSCHCIDTDVHSLHTSDIRIDESNSRCSTVNFQPIIPNCLNDA